MKKLPNKISTEDLLKALEDKDSEKSTAIQEALSYDNDIPQFLVHYNIEPGNHPVPKRLLYQLYGRFSKEKVIGASFGNTICKFLEHNNYEYMINRPRAEIAKILNKKSRKGWIKYSPAHPATRKHYEEFLNDLNLLNGTKWIEGYLLRELYYKWCRSKNKSIRFKPRPFSSISKLFLPHRKTVDIELWFKVPENALDYLTQEEIRKIQDDRNSKLAENRKIKQKQKDKEKRRASRASSIFKSEN